MMMDKMDELTERLSVMQGSCQSIELCIVSGRAGWPAQLKRRLREAWEGLSDDGQREGEMGADFGRKVEKKKKWLILSFVSLSCKVVAIESNLLAGREGRGEECGEVGGGDRILKEESSLSTRKMEKEVGGKVEEVDLVS